LRASPVTLHIITSHGLPSASPPKTDTSSRSCQTCRRDTGIRALPDRGLALVKEIGLSRILRPRIELYRRHFRESADAMLVAVNKAAVAEMGTD
jgi:hypothetical protein